MKRLFLACLAGMLASALPPVAAFAKDDKAGDVKVEVPWSRATPGGAKVGAGYLKITNTGSEPDRLMAVESAIAEHVEIHEMKIESGIMRMRKLADGLALPPGQTVELKPTGYHLMFLGLKGPIEKDKPFAATLTFQNAGKISVDFAVAGIGAMGPGASTSSEKKKSGMRGSHQ
ncbi:MAG: copper chaperone PCu(A)C [Methyloligellaceae bacterium]